MADETAFEVVTDTEIAPGSRLIAGFSHLGLAGLSAADYLVKHLDFENVAHVRARGFPAIAPFEEGRPRHPMRVYTNHESDISVLVNELFIPVWATEPFADGILGWVDEVGIDEITVPYGIPYPHAPDQHAVFYSATPGYRAGRLDSSPLSPLAGGFFDGVVGELVLRSLDDGAPPVGVFVTPSHPPGPDFEAALLLLEAIQEVYDVSVDEQELRETIDQMKQYFANLADQMETLRQNEPGAFPREHPEDRMFM